MLTILDFKLSRQSDELYDLRISLRNERNTLATASIRFPNFFLMEFQLSQLEFNVNDPSKRFELIRKFGSDLYQIIFTREVKDVWQQHHQNSDFLVLCLRTDEGLPEIEALPWEALFDGKEFIAAGEKTSLSRLSLATPPKKVSSPTSLPLRMLSIISNPLGLSDGERLQVENERELLLDSIDAPAGEGTLFIDLEDEASLDVIKSRLELPYHILHFAGHGISAEKGGGLLLEDNEGRKRETSIVEILTLLENANDSLKLIVLVGCQTGKALAETGFLDLAHALSARGVPAVVGMQFSISDAGGLQFARTFYEQVALGTSLEIAVSMARRDLLNFDDYSVQADAFAIILLTADGDCLSTTNGQLEPVEETQTKRGFRHINLPPLDHGFYGRNREFRRIRNGLLKNQYQAIIIYGMGGMGKTALATYLAVRLEKVFEDAIVIDCSTSTVSPESVVSELHQSLVTRGVAGFEPLLNRELHPLVLAGLLAEELLKRSLLLIFDNFENQLEYTEGKFRIADPSLRDFLILLVNQTSDGSRFIFTTRQLFDLSHDEQANRIDAVLLGEFTYAEASSFMQRLPNLSRAWPMRRKLYLTFGGHPYSLVMLNNYCKSHSLEAALKNTESINTQLRAFVAIELTYNLISARSRTLLIRLAPFRKPVPTLAAEWLMGEVLPPDPEVIKKEGYVFQSSQWGKVRLWLPNVADERNESLLNLMEEKRSLGLVSDLIEELQRFGLISFIELPDRSVRILIHSLVRGFCKEKQDTDNWRKDLKEAAKFYLKDQQYLEPLYVAPAKAIEEFESIDLLLEAEDYDFAWRVLNSLFWAIARQGRGHKLEKYFLKVKDKLEGKSLAINLHNLGHIYEWKDDIERALKYFQLSLEIKRTLGDAKGEARTLHHIGNVYLRGHEPQTALGFYESALKLGEATSDQSVIAKALHHIGTVYEEQGQLELAGEHYKRAYELLRSIGEPDGLWRICLALSSWAHKIGDHEQSLQFGKSGLLIAEESNDLEGISGCLLQIGIIQITRGEYSEALEGLSRALSAAEQRDLKSYVCNILRQIGFIHRQLMDYSNAVKYYEWSFEIARNFADAGFLATARSDMGYLHFLMGEYELALEDYKYALEKLESYGGNEIDKLPVELATILHQIGLMLQLLGQNQIAMTYFERSLRLSVEVITENKVRVVNQELAAATFHNMGRGYKASMEYTGALEMFEYSLQLKQSLGDMNGMGNSQGEIGDIHTETGNYPEAFALLADSLRSYDQAKSTNRDVTVRRLSKLRVKWGEQAFEGAWRQRHGESVPDWLKGGEM